MELTKYGHSCVAFTAGDDRLVVDPGAFSDTAAALDGAGGVLVTHEHADHVDVDAVRAALRADPRLRLWAPSSVADVMHAGEQVVAVAPGDEFAAAGFAVRAFGGQHAMIHISLPTIANVGYRIESGGRSVFHPGDSLEVPAMSIDTLLLPVSAPWSKVSEVIDYAVGVRAPRVLPIHDAVANDLYRGMVQGHVGRVAGPFGVQYDVFADGDTVAA